MSSGNGKIKGSITIIVRLHGDYVNCCMFYCNNKNLISVMRRITENSNLMNCWTKVIIL
jgi:hypothetical protein